MVAVNLQVLWKPTNFLSSRQMHLFAKAYQADTSQSLIIGLTTGLVSVHTSPSLQLIGPNASKAQKRSMWMEPCPMLEWNSSDPPGSCRINLMLQAPPTSSTSTLPSCSKWVGALHAKDGALMFAGLCCCMHVGAGAAHDWQAGHGQYRCRASAPQQGF